MKIQYASDLHLELNGNSRCIASHNPLTPTGDVLVLAGDSFYLKDKVAPMRKFWKWASANYEQVMLVPGNHEYYGGSDVAERGDSWQWQMLDNVGYYQNKVVRLGHTDLILSTLWSHIGHEEMFSVWHGMNDFRQIMYNGHRFRPDDFNAEHAKCLAFIKEAVAKSDAEHIVVATHHLPTMQVVAPQHKGSSLNSAFATELGEFIAGSRIDYWIYGHSHTNINAQIGRTKIVCNQMGYVDWDEHKQGFKGDACIEI